LNGDVNDPKRSRACEACRGLKVRCDQDPAHPEIPCKRCAKAKRQCIITAPSRKRQKKTDSRVAELEKKIDALTASLHAQNKDGSDNKDADNMSPDEISYGAPASLPSVTRVDSRENKDWVDRVRRRSSVHRPADYSSCHTIIGAKRRRLSDDQGELSTNNQGTG